MMTKDQFAVAILTGIAYGIIGGTVRPKDSASALNTALHSYRQKAYGAKGEESSKRFTLQYRYENGA